MNIGQAAQASGLSSKAIRYYEDLGLVVPARDQNNDYRVYSTDDVERLRFLHRVRVLGCSLDECRELLVIYMNPDRRCEQVGGLVMDKIAQVDSQLSTLTALRDTLSRMAGECVAAGQALPDEQPPAKKLPSPTRSVAMAFTLLGESDPS